MVDGDPTYVYVLCVALNLAVTKVTKRAQRQSKRPIFNFQQVQPEQQQ